MFFPSAYGKLRANRRETARLTVQKSVQRDVLAQHLPDGLCDAQVGRGIRSGGLHVDDHQIIAPEIPDEPGGGVHHQTGAATQMGAKVVTMSDSNGYVYDPNGIDLAYVKDLKEVRRGRIKEYAETHAGATYVADCTQVWTVPCDIALPCATQNEINKESAEALVKGGCTVVCEGANMPSTPEAIEVYLSNGILYGPAKASNAGGVATSGLEMSQNSERLSWSFEEVDAKLKGIMEGIFHASYDASVAAGSEGNLMVGANCAGFLKVATAMMAQGITY